MNTDQEKKQAQHLLDLREANCSMRSVCKGKAGSLVVLLLCSCALIVAAWAMSHQDWPSPRQGVHEQILCACLGGLMLGVLLLQLGLAIGTKARWAFTRKTVDWTEVERIARTGTGANKEIHRTH